jgi:hypothetical protein
MSCVLEYLRVKYKEVCIDPSVNRIFGDQDTMMNCIIYMERLIW